MDWYRKAGTHMDMNAISNVTSTASAAATTATVKKEQEAKTDKTGGR